MTVKCYPLPPSNPPIAGAGCIPLQGSGLLEAAEVAVVCHHHCHAVQVTLLDLGGTRLTVQWFEL